MIQSLSLLNFQSHKSSSLVFSKGVNVIIGSSNSGKTAILRGLKWVRYNRPLGLDFVSHWNQDGKGNPKENTAVALLKDDEMINRIRSKSFNGYTITTDESDLHGTDETSLEAVGTDVPEEIEKRLNLSEVNIQEQMDAPFLLSQGPAEVARFFNQIIRLDLIDRVLGNAENRRRKLKQATEANAQEIQKLQSSINDMAWWAEADKLINRMDRVSQRKAEAAAQRDRVIELMGEKLRASGDITHMNVILEEAEPLVAEADKLLARVKLVGDQAERLFVAIGEYNSQQKVLQDQTRLLKAEPIFLSLQALYHNQQQNINQESVLADSLRSYRKALANSRIEGIEEAETLCKSIATYHLNLRSQAFAIKSLSEALASYRTQQEVIEETQRQQQAAEKLMPDVCPTCGAPMKGASNEIHIHG